MINFFIKQKKLLDPEDKYPIRLFHWSHAEQTIMEKIFQRHPRLLKLWDEYFAWVDMCDIFVKTPIVVRGAVTFKLKDIAKAMFSLNLITTTWTSDINSGFAAMQSAAEYYRNKNSNVMNDIEEYNMVDCKVMWDIVKYLRLNNF